MVTNYPMKGAEFIRRRERNETEITEKRREIPSIPKAL